MAIKLACLACGQGNRIPEDRLGRGAKCGTCGEALIKTAPVEVSLDVLKKAERLDWMNCRWWWTSGRPGAVRAG